MRNMIRRNDIFRASASIPILRSFSAELVMANPTYTKMVAAMPDWLTPASIGFALAVWLIDPWTNDSRLRQLWKWLFDRFEIVDLVVQEPLTAKRDVLAITLNLRFRRTTKGHLWLRIFSCTGLSQEPHESVIDLGAIDVPKGGRKTIEVARLAIQHPGWDHNQPQGWAVDHGNLSLVPGSENIAQIELTGVAIRQIARFFVSHTGHGGGEIRPQLFVMNEDEDIFDASRNTRR